MSAPVKMGMVVTQPTAFVERNPDFVAHVRRSMERDIRDSGRLIDSESWTREELDGFPAPMTRFALDAVSQAHVIVLIHNEGRYTSTTVHEVQVGTTQAAQKRVDALNVEHGHFDKFDPEDGAWWGDHFEVQTVPLGYATSEVQVTQEFRAQSTTDRMRDIRIGTERMHG